MTTSPQLAINVLGPLQVTLDGVPVRRFKYNKARALLVYLALAPERAASRAEVCALLWPERSEQAARRNLAQILTALRAALSPDALLASPDTLQLPPGWGLTVDASRFSQLLEAAEHHPHRAWVTCPSCLARLQTALPLYRGEFLAQFFLADNSQFEEWALLWRERLRQRALTAWERLAARAEWCGDFARSAECLRRIVVLDSLREESQRELIRLLALDGQWAAADAAYEQLRRMLASEFGLAPEAQTEKLRAQLRTRSSAGLRRWAAPVYRGPEAPNGLMGRERELAGVVARLQAEAGRAVTLVGTAGLGKTQLALAVAQAVRYDYEDGVVVVELAAVAAAGGVAGAVAHALGVVEQAGQAVSQTVLGVLKRRQVLLVLDNFEHVLGAAGQVGEWLAGCPGLKVLVTSRVPLRLRAEQVVALEPLLEGAAVALFAARARAVRAGFDLTPANAATVAALCARLEPVMNFSGW